MRFSVWPTTRQSWPDFLDIAAHAEATGWEGVWAADHFMPAGPPLDAPTLECWAVLAGLATAVPRVRIGSLVAGNTYRHPAVLANAAATIDQLSGGRLVLGIGAGWQANEHEAYGLVLPSVRERLQRLEEACAVITTLFDQPRSTFDGRYYTLSEAPMEPKPLQRPMPLLVGGGGERVTLRIAARWAHEWNTWGEPDLLERKNAVLDAHCEAVAHDPSTIRRSAQAIVEPDGIATTKLPYPTISGSVERIRDVMGRYVAAGVHEFVLPDWNAGVGQGRRDFFDWFSEEIAASTR